MLLFLIRHGDAVDDAPGLGDTGRWLSPEGRELTRQVALWLKQHAEARPARLVTSPLVRAVQTAEVLAHALELDGPVDAWGSLSTRGSPKDTLALLRAHLDAEGLGLVGHEPTLSELALLLLGSTASWSGFDKSGVLALRWDGRSPAKRLFYTEPRRVLG